MKNYHSNVPIETEGWTEHLKSLNVDPIRFSQEIDIELKTTGKVNIRRLSRVFKRSYPTTKKWVDIYIKEKGSKS